MKGAGRGREGYYYFFFFEQIWLEFSCKRAERGGWGRKSEAYGREKGTKKEIVTLISMRT